MSPLSRIAARIADHAPRRTGSTVYTACWSRVANTGGAREEVPTQRAAAAGAGHNDDARAAEPALAAWQAGARRQVEAAS
eukprot:COSAG02_NODE_2262_length_9317_cov_21.181927_14_plen_80_part_00